MGKFRNFVLGTTALVGLAATTATSALAEGFEIREQSAWGQGASYAGVAAGGADLLCAAAQAPALPGTRDRRESGMPH